jgi:CubicO group peptidase (beta-lactamase class C family)
MNVRKSGNKLKAESKRGGLTVIIFSLLAISGLFPILCLAGGAPQANSAPSIVGIWSGNLKSGGASLFLVLHVKKSDSGALEVALDSPQQGALGLAGSDVTLHGDKLSFKIPVVNGSYTGTVSADGKTISGTWSQGVPLPLEFTRGNAAGVEAAAKAAPKPHFLPAQAPVPVSDLKPVLDKELAPLLANGLLAEKTGRGIVIGVFEKGQQRIFAYGDAKPDSIFEIGSLTKTFTALALAQLVEQKKVALDEPVLDLLPSGSVPKPSGAEITLLSLATHHSGLPRLPSNLSEGMNPRNPYANYHWAQLKEFLDHHGLAQTSDAPFLYSNLGYGLLGYALARQAGVSYPQLIREEVTGPLGMNETTVALSPKQEKLFLTGHNAQNAAVDPWTFKEAMAGAGALRSTAGDLLKYLEAQLDADKLAAGAKPDSIAATLPAAIALTHKLFAGGPMQMRIGLAWLYIPTVATYWHDGGTGGFSSFAAFTPSADRAVVVLYNREDIAPGHPMFVNRVCDNVIALLTGKPAIALGN